MKWSATSVTLLLAIVLCGCDRRAEPADITTHSSETHHRTSTTVNPPLIGQKRQEFWADFLKLKRRQGSQRSLVEAVPASKLVKQYVVQFDTNAKGHPGPEWRPLYVIAWKAENVDSIVFDPIHRSVISVNGHTLRPSLRKQAVYALQPDYSLREVPLTGPEANRVFSHISKMERRTDERVASLVADIEQDAPNWMEKVATEALEEHQFVSNKDWEERVESHLEVVEPDVLEDK